MVAGGLNWWGKWRGKFWPVGMVVGFGLCTGLLGVALDQSEPPHGIWCTHVLLNIY